MKYKDCSITLKNDILTIENSCIQRTYKWNDGALISLSFANKNDDLYWGFSSNKPDCILPGHEHTTAEGVFEVSVFQGNTIIPDHLQGTVISQLGAISLKQNFRIYPNCPAIACDFHIKGCTSTTWDACSVDSSGMSQLENSKAASEDQTPASVLETISINSTHITYDSIQFYDVTDRRNNLVLEEKGIPYTRPKNLNGQLLFLKDSFSNKGIFLLKEAPCSDIQLNTTEHNFVICTNSLQLTGIGVSPSDITEDSWTRCYGYVCGVAKNDDFSMLSALRTYQNQLRLYSADRDHMIVQNTWGDRGQDTKLNESFVEKEIAAAEKLGISHLQLDDGWQEGLSANSAFEGGSFDALWDNPNYWDINQKKFPHGLTHLIEDAKAKGVEICLWFNPCKDNSYEHGEKDADCMIKLYQKYGIRIFKIDGVVIPDKQADINVRAMFDKVLQETDNEVVFNLDLTAGKRFGYHYFSEYGNKFLENRYTDWGNYYPHWTLRNLWQLSKYVPTQALQIEFLNKWRNQDKYPANDPLAPINIPFEYCFAVTMMAQPLAWFEASNLPEEAFEIAPLMKTYRQHQVKVHQGTILPIGDEPNGTNWTGFQSIQDDEGYICIYRELNNCESRNISLWGFQNQEIEFQLVAGQGSDFKTTASEGQVSFSLPQKLSFALYKYKVG